MKKRSLDAYLQEMKTKVKDFYEDLLKMNITDCLDIRNYYYQSLTCP